MLSLHKLISQDGQEYNVQTVMFVDPRILSVSIMVTGSKCSIERLDEVLSVTSFSDLDSPGKLNLIIS